MAESLVATGRPNQRTEDTGLARIDSSTSELAPSRAAAAEQFEIQSAIVLARKFPRNEEQAFAQLMRACDRPSFAKDVEYSFPRGGENIAGPSVYLAREAARVWGNIRYGLTILRDDAETRQIEGWAWDLETNTKVAAQDDFRKVVQRKRNGQTSWIPADERDLRELTNRRGAILVRNCILQLLPSDLVDDAVGRALATLEDKARKDPDGERKKIILAFSEINVTPEMLGEFLGHPLAQCSPEEIARLRGVFKSIKDGNSTWDEYLHPREGSGAGRTVGTPKPKSAAPEPPPQQQQRSQADLDRLAQTAEDSGVPPMQVEAASYRLYGKPPIELTETEFDVLLGWVKNGGEEPK